MLVVFLDAWGKLGKKRINKTPAIREDDRGGCGLLTFFGRHLSVTDTVQIGHGCRPKNVKRTYRRKLQPYEFIRRSETSPATFRPSALADIASSVSKTCVNARATSIFAFFVSSEFRR